MDGRRALDPVHEVVRFFVISKPEQRVEIERRVAEPDIPVIPVPDPADRLWQGGGRGGRDGPGLGIGERLQDQGAPQHKVAVWAAIREAGGPALPEPSGLVEAPADGRWGHPYRTQAVRLDMGDDGRRLF